MCNLPNYAWQPWPQSLSRTHLPLQAAPDPLPPSYEGPSHPFIIPLDWEAFPRTPSSWPAWTSGSIPHQPGLTDHVLAHVSHGVELLLTDRSFNDVPRGNSFQTPRFPKGTKSHFHPQVQDALCVRKGSPKQGQHLGEVAREGRRVTIYWFLMACPSAQKGPSRGPG